MAKLKATKRGWTGLQLIEPGQEFEMADPVPPATWYESPEGGPLKQKSDAAKKAEVAQADKQVDNPNEEPEATPVLLMEEDKDLPKEEAGAGGKISIAGSLDITLADGTVEKRPFTAQVPIANIPKEKKDG